MSEIHSKAKGFQNECKQTKWYQTKDGFDPIFLYLNYNSTLWYYKFNIKLYKTQLAIITECILIGNVICLSLVLQLFHTDDERLVCEVQLIDSEPILDPRYRTTVLRDPWILLMLRFLLHNLDFIRCFRNTQLWMILGQKCTQPNDREGRLVYKAIRAIQCKQHCRWQVIATWHSGKQIRNLQTSTAHELFCLRILRLCVCNNFCAYLAYG